MRAAEQLRSARAPLEFLRAGSGHGMKRVVRRQRGIDYGRRDRARFVEATLAWTTTRFK
jgi:hypothetical protein